MLRSLGRKIFDVEGLGFTKDGDDGFDNVEDGGWLLATICVGDHPTFLLCSIV